MGDKLLDNTYVSGKVSVANDKKDSNNYILVADTLERLENMYMPLGTVEVELGTTWTTEGIYYVQTIQLLGITSEDSPIIGLKITGTTVNSIKQQRSEFGNIIKIDSVDNGLKVYALKQTAVELTLLVKGR